MWYVSKLLCSPPYVELRIGILLLGFPFKFSRGPLERPEADSKESKARNHQRKQPRGRAAPHRERKWSSSGRNGDRNIADVKIELGPMPFDPKY